MFEPTSSGGTALLLKAYGLKVLLGAAGAAAVFLVMWPKSAEEGASRLFAGIMSSVLWGDVGVAWARAHFDWIPAGGEMDRAIYAAVGAVAWFILGCVVRLLIKARDSGSLPALPAKD